MLQQQQLQQLQLHAHAAAPRAISYQCMRDCVHACENACVHACVRVWGRECMVATARVGRQVDWIVYRNICVRRRTPCNRARDCIVRAPMRAPRRDGAHVWHAVVMRAHMRAVVRLRMRARASNAHRGACALGLHSRVCAHACLLLMCLRARITYGYIQVQVTGTGEVRLHRPSMRDVSRKHIRARPRGPTRIHVSCLCMCAACMRDVTRLRIDVYRTSACA